MVYIIISNIGLAIMMIYIYSRYSHFRIISAKEIHELRSKNDAQSNELRDFDAKFLSSIKSYQDRVEALLIEVGKVRQEKEKELELRTQIEKKFEILQQKNTDFETIHSEITNAILNIVNDNHETAKNLSKDLYEKINDSYKKQSQENHKLIAQINENITDIAEKFVDDKDKNIADNPDYTSLLKISNNPIAKNTFVETIRLLENNQLKPKKDYFILQKIDENESRRIFAEVVIIKNNILHLLDFKGTSYIFEYFALKAKNDKNAEGLMEYIFRKYLNLLASNNYFSSTKEALNFTNINYDSHKIIIVIPTLSEMKLLKELQLFDKARQLNIQIFDIQDFTKIL